MRRFLRSVGRLAFIGVWIVLLFLIATNIQSGWLYVIISFLLLLCAVSVVMPWYMMRRLRVRVELPGMCERGSEAQATVFVENAGRAAAFIVKVKLDGGGGLEFEPPGLVLMRVAGRSAAAQAASFRPSRRGPARMGAVELSCGAPAGIYTVRRSFDTGASTLVYPKISQKKGEEMAGAAADMSSGRREKFFALEDPYNYRLREYTPGDSLRRLHWKLTARRDRPIVRIHERKIYGHAGIFVDNLRASYGPGGDAEFEELLEQAVSLARYLLFTRGSSVTIAAAAAPELSLESPDSWPMALKWFATIRLEDTPAGAAGPAVGPAEPDFAFAPGARRKGAAT